MSTKAYRIIVVDDDPELRSLLTRFLAEHGFDTTWLRRAIGDSGDDPPIHHNCARGSRRLNKEEWADFVEKVGSKA